MITTESAAKFLDNIQKQIDNLQEVVLSYYQTINEQQDLDRENRIDNLIEGVEKIQDKINDDK